MPWRRSPTRRTCSGRWGNGADAVDQAAAELRERVVRYFWVESDAGRHLAIALDGSGAAVDGLGSNMGRARDRHPHAGRVGAGGRHRHR